MIEGAERRQRILTGFPGASHVLSKLPFRTLAFPLRAAPVEGSETVKTIQYAPDASQ